MNIIQKIGHLLLAVLLLVSTTGVTLHKHYCLGQLKGVSYFAPSSCYEDAGCDNETFKMACCGDSTEHFQVDTDLSKTSIEFHFNLSMTPVKSLLAKTEIPSLFSQESSSYSYKPPLIERDIPIHIQSFLL